MIHFSSTIFGESEQCGGFPYLSNDRGGFINYRLRCRTAYQCSSRSSLHDSSCCVNSFKLFFRKKATLVCQRQLCVTISITEPPSCGTAHIHHVWHLCLLQVCFFSLQLGCTIDSHSGFVSSTDIFSSTAIQMYKTSSRQLCVWEKREFSHSQQTLSSSNAEL